jgi:hypothetical protein
VRAFGPIQRADIALKTNGNETMIEIDAPRDTELKVGDVIGLKPKRYRIFRAEVMHLQAFPLILRRREAPSRRMQAPALATC